MALQLLFLILSLVILFFGAEIALETAEKIGKAFGLSSLVVGIFIIGLGTSLPELFVSHLASMRGNYGIALGNIFGSNLANILLVLGVTTLWVKLDISSTSMRLQSILHLILSCLLIVPFLNDVYHPFAGLLLFAFFLFYLFHSYTDMKKEQKLLYPKDDLTMQAEQELAEEDAKESLQIKSVFKLIAGFALLYGGGELLVSSGSKLGAMAGISEYAISAIVVAFGTSFPELVTALLAAYKRKDVNLITGNIIGSNLFNAAFIFGSLAVYKMPFPNKPHVEIAALIALSLVFIVHSRIKLRLGKFIGIVFLSSYIGFVVYWS